MKTGDFEIVSLGGAIKHQDYRPMRTDKWGEDWTIIPVDGYGDQETIRGLIRQEKPDLLWFMTDPRFWGWLWMIENEVRPYVPMVYYHVWDNFPAPKYNKPFYESTDLIVSISQVTRDIVKEVSPDTWLEHIPHAVDTDVFKKYDDIEVEKFKADFLPANLQDKFVFFWNNRNARRKQSGTLLVWWKTFLEKTGIDDAVLLLHTEPRDPNGQDLITIIEDFDLSKEQVVLSTQKYPAEILARIYNVADCTINISDAEGFGLATLESLACETPIIVNKTGGLKEQLLEGENGFGIEPVSRSIIGSLDTPYIYEDRITEGDFHDALEKMYKLSEKGRGKFGKRGREHVLENYNFDDFESRWVNVMREAHEKLGSWHERKEYKGWRAKEI